jgi:NAD-dependent deacetylase
MSEKTFSLMELLATAGSTPATLLEPAIRREDIAGLFPRAPPAAAGVPPPDAKCDSCGKPVGSDGGRSRYYDGAPLCKSCYELEDLAPALPEHPPRDTTKPSDKEYPPRRPATVRRSTYVGDAGNRELGLFSTRYILGGELVAYFSGDAAGPIVGDPAHPSDRTVGEGDKYEDAAARSSKRGDHIGHYANTADSEKYFNVILKLVQPTGKPSRYGLVALHDIPKKRELITDYGDAYWSTRGGRDQVKDPEWPAEAPPQSRKDPEEVVVARRTRSRAEPAAAAVPPTAHEVPDPPERLREVAKRFSEILLTQRQMGNLRFVAFTGAGMSTASGVPDYRGATGVAAGGSIAPAQSRETHPSAAHMALSALMAAGWLEFVITTNTDELDLRAGTPADRLVQLHGSSFVARCPNCGEVRRCDDDVSPAGHDRSHATSKACYNCGQPMVDTVLQEGEDYDEETYKRAESASAGATAAIVLGTTLKMGAMLDLIVSTPKDARLLCTLGKVPTDLRRKFTENMRTHADVGAFLTELARLLGVGVGSYQEINDLRMPGTLRLGDKTKTSYGKKP